MSPPPGTGVCQGNFAASVKEILPIYQRGILADTGFIEANSFQELPTICGANP